MIELSSPSTHWFVFLTDRFGCRSPNSTGKAAKENRLQIFAFYNTHTPTYTCNGGQKKALESSLSLAPGCLELSAAKISRRSRKSPSKEKRKRGGGEKRCFVGRDIKEGDLAGRNLA